MTAPLFKKTLAISLAGHLTLFSLLSLSFGKVIPARRGESVWFWGRILRNSDLSENNIFTGKYNRLSEDASLPVSGLARPETIGIGNFYPAAKPQLRLSISEKKTQAHSYAFPAPSLRQQSVVMLYPILPKHFLLYFKDRQLVHMEIMFNVIPGGPVNSITLKRKISSGNLEADLLAMRYLGHYIFIRQKEFPANEWQTVKIELSPNNN